MMPYILHVAVIISLCLVFYKILLRNETFYRINRMLLVLCILVAFLLPLVPVPQQWSLLSSNNQSWTSLLENKPQEATAGSANTREALSTGSAPTQKIRPATSSPAISAAGVLAYLYWFGVAAFGINFFVQILSLVNRARKSEKIIDGRFRIVELSGNHAPCSFGNYIFINPAKYDWETYSQILLHEKVHVRQMHTLDIIVAELMIIFQWFNPFAWIYRREIDNNLEYLTDNELLEAAGVEQQTYQLSLVKVSVPHLPLSVTTNYNQSLLKKRIAMMNAKRSSLGSAWKYFFMLPVLILSACLLNEPVVFGQENNIVKEKRSNSQEDKIPVEGSWFATIKGNTISMQLKNHEGDGNYNQIDFSVSEFSALPRDNKGTFTLTREAGVMEFTGRFEGNEGMGNYTFKPNRDYGSSMEKELSEKLSDHDMLNLFLVNAKKSDVQMLKEEGFSNVDKEHLVPIVALKIDKQFIRSIKENGFKDVKLEELIPLKALKIDGEYIKEMSGSLKNLSVQEIIALKSQGVDIDYVRKMKAARKDAKDNGDMDADEVVQHKALQIDADYVNQMKNAGLDNLSNRDLISMKSMGITPEYVKEFIALGYAKADAGQLIAAKSQEITAEYIRSFDAIGYKNLPLEQLASMKALGVTPEYIKSFEKVGFKNISFEEAITLKASEITADWVRSMQDKGFNYSNIEKYITLKGLAEK